MPSNTTVETRCWASVLVMFGLVVAGTVLGALLARQFSKAAPIRGKSPNDTP
jgi:hypothetical protein